MNKLVPFLLSLFVVFSSFSQSKKKQIEILENRIDSLNNVLSAERTLNDRKVEELNTKITKLESQITNLEGQVSNLKNNLNDQTKQLNDSKSEASQKQTKIIELNEQVQSKSDSLVILKNELAKLKPATKYTPVVNTTNIKSHELETPSKVVDVDGNEYNTVRIRDKIWITENLKTKHFNDGQPIEQVEDFNSWLHINTPAYCDPSKYYNVESDGLLYNHYVVQRGGVCPQGFQIPSEKVIDSLIDYYKGFGHGYLLGGLWTGPHSKMINFDDLNKQYENGTFNFPSSGFNFQDGAYRSGHKFYSDNNGYSDILEAFWLKDKVSEFDDETQARAVKLYWWESLTNETLKKENDEMNAGNYIRCYKEYSSVKNTEKPVNLVDKDGNTYKTVKIGNQIWMAEDLKVIPDGVRLVFNSADLNHYWGAVCYDNFEKNGAITYSERSFYKYVENKFIEQDVCPQGWHLPDKGEWEMLLKYYSMNDLKSTTGWIYSSRINTYNKNGTNKSGLNLKPDKWQTIEKPRALYLFKDHLSNGTSTLKIDFYGHSFDAEKNYDENQGHVRCVKD